MAEVVQPDWKREGRVHFAKHGGKWLVATNKSPFFCFEADTKAKARELARSAFAKAGTVWYYRQLAPPLA